MKYLINQKEKEFLQETCDDLDIEFRLDYSGRFMYGKSCIGFVSQETIRPILNIIRELYSYDFDDLANALIDYNSSTDSMGHSTIVYWPGISCDDSSQETSAHE